MHLGTDSELKLPGIFRAKVLDNNDPKQFGRIKAEILPVMANLTKDELPWAVPALPIFSGSGLGHGSFIVPDINSFVFVFFEHEDLYQPVYILEAPTAQFGLPDSRIVNYPFRKVYKTKNGIEIIIDDFSKLVRINHPTGTFIEIQEDGNIKLDPSPTKKSIINAFSRTIKTYSSDVILTGNDGGLVLVNGAITLTLPSPISFPGLEYVFERIDTGTDPARVTNLVEVTGFVEFTGIYSGVHLISGGTGSGKWHVI